MASLHPSTSKFMDTSTNLVGMGSTIMTDPITSEARTVTHGTIRTTTKRVLISVAKDTAPQHRMGTTTEDNTTATIREDNTLTVIIRDPIMAMVTITKDRTRVAMAMALALDIREDPRTVPDISMDTLTATTTTLGTELEDMAVTTGALDAVIKIGKN